MNGGVQHKSWLLDARVWRQRAHHHVMTSGILNTRILWPLVVNTCSDIADTTFEIIQCMDVSPRTGYDCGRRSKNQCKKSDLFGLFVNLFPQLLMTSLVAAEGVIDILFNDSYFCDGERPIGSDFNIFSYQPKALARDTNCSSNFDYPIERMLWSIDSFLRTIWPKEKYTVIVADH